MSYLLQETGDFLLQETTDKIILDEAGVSTFVSVGYVGGTPSGVVVTQL